MPVRNLAVSLTTEGFNNGTGLKQKDFRGEASRLLTYVRDNIRYVGDIRDIEVLHDPETLLRTGAGDCDDKAILLAALLLSIGHQPRFVAVAFEPDAYSHVWLQDLIYGEWLDLEPTEPIACGQSIPTKGAVSLIYQDA
jgi:transglutaminase-like putative cysteine protease